MAAGKLYIAALVSIGASIISLPTIDDLFKLTLLVTVVALTVLINLLFQAFVHIEKLRNAIVDNVVANVMMAVFKDPDIRKLMTMTAVREKEKEKESK